jgi:hypothetical protein
MNMHAINNGKLFWALHCRLRDNPITPIAQPQIIQKGLKGSNPRNEQLTFLVQPPQMDPPFIHSCIYCSYVNLFSVKLLTAEFPGYQSLNYLQRSLFRTSFGHVI